MKTKLSCLLMLLSISVFGQTAEIQAIKNSLQKQTKCWNKGDLECFMETYWHSDSLTFIGKNGVIKGWEATLQRYKETYPDREAMGYLSFEILSVKLISSEAGYVIGKWHLDRAHDNLNGHFSLLWKYIHDQWVIVSDHSS